MSPAPQKQSLRSYLLLTRTSLAPSAAVDALIGLSLGAAGWFPGFGPALLAACASLCVFLGGMALNDWADREVDARERPERPIPSGSIPAPNALQFAIGLLLLGVGLGFLLSVPAGLCLAFVAACAATYDLALRGPTAGPLCLALCRAGNLTFGILVARTHFDFPWNNALLLPPLAYGLYVGFVSVLSGYEDGARELNQVDPKRILLAAAIVLACLPLSALALRPQPAAWAYLLGLSISCSAAFGLWRHARQVEVWTRQTVGQAMGMSLRRLMLATAALGATALHGTLFAWFAILCAVLGMLLSHRLRKAFPPS